MKKIVLTLSLSLFLLASACSAPAKSEAAYENPLPELVATEMPAQPPQKALTISVTYSTVPAGDMFALRPLPA